MTSVCRRSSKSGFTYIELLVSVLILSIVAASAVATWGLLGRAPANKRATEIGMTIAVQEIERVKAIRYGNLVDSSLDGSGNVVPAVRWYDRHGNWLGSGATGGDLQVRLSVRPVLDRDTTPNPEDLREIRVEVWSGDGARMLERARTLLAFGGL